jgi:primosomal protein N' (replication factor Y) (superfamily II helicase)
MIVDVAVPYHVSRSFHYLVDSETAGSLSLGSVIQVPFRRRSIHGFVLGFPEQSPFLDKLLPIESVLVAEPLFDESMLKFLRWLSEYYCHPLGEVISGAIPRQYWAPKKTKKERKTTQNDVEIGLVPKFKDKPVPTQEQEFAIARILSCEEQDQKKPYLLHGVTGSGKTEVYMTVLEQVLAEGKGAIILVPEIALTPQLLGRFSARFPGSVAVLHSDLTVKERFLQWEKLRTGQARIVVGARSAVFAPIKNLGLIVVDEEHESSFKQEDQLRYNARDAAIVRGNFEKAKVVLGSATPSLESYHNAQTGKYVYLTLKSRVQERPMPKTTFVDLKDKSQVFNEETPWISRTLLRDISKTLEAGQQALLYLNRLGFAHFLFCKDCGHTWRCTNCEVALTYYQAPPQLKCHYCGKTKRVPETCEECSGNTLETMGVGTEQLEKSLIRFFPKARIARMDRSVLKTRRELEQVLNQISRRDVDIVIGTQMVTKGHDFPGIALVGILVADASLNLPDFRAHERTFQIITQVSGRAGRAEIPGEVVIQTVNPDHPVLQAAALNRSVDFYTQELEARARAGFPPFSRLAMLRFQHKNERKVEAFACELVRGLHGWLEQHKINCSVIGPSEAPLSRLKNFYRWQCLIRSDSVKHLQQALHAAKEYHEAKKAPVQMAVDVDPMNSL